MTGQVLLGVVLAPLAPLGIRVAIALRIRRRRRAIEEELPTALSLLASSLEAGHTLVRAVDLMSQETNGPLAEEFAVVLAETRLGAPLADAMDRMADRVEIEDLEWVVQAIRIQQEVGGRLSELLHTLAEYLLAREEVRREVSVLTAEGRAVGVAAGRPAGRARLRGPAAQPRLPRHRCSACPACCCWPTPSCSVAARPVRDPAPRPVGEL